MDRKLLKIKEWRDFRISINDKNEVDQLTDVVEYWSKAPLVNYVLDYNTFKEWPTPWELISEDYFDSITIAYLMMETLITLKWNKDRFVLSYIKPDDNSDYIMVLIVDNKYVLNYSYNEIYDINDLKYDKCLINIKYENDILKEI